MAQYGKVLTTYATNAPCVNDAVFTLFHHVVVSLDKPQALFQPAILTTFADMWDGGYDLNDEWADILAVVMKVFLDQINGTPGPSLSLGDINPE